jgi:flagellar basal body-associated protein FliL
MSSRTSAKRNSDWTLAAGIGLGTLLTAASVWAYARSTSPMEIDRPVPAWLGVTRAMPQMSDGRMLAVQVQLRLDDQEAVAQLGPMGPAFKGLVMDVAHDLSRDDLVGTEGMKQYGKAIKAAINEYLAEQHRNERVRKVDFEELLVMP